MIVLFVYVLSVVACFMSFVKLNKCSGARIGVVPGTLISIFPVLNLVPIVIYFVEYGPDVQFFKKIDNWFRGV